MLGEEKMQQPFRHVDHTELGGGFRKSLCLDKQAALVDISAIA
jgi:hypothetical protein